MGTGEELNALTFGWSGNQVQGGGALRGDLDGWLDKRGSGTPDRRTDRHGGGGRLFRSSRDWCLSKRCVWSLSRS